MEFVYYSSGTFGAQILQYLTKKPTTVFTQPDRLGGRGMRKLIPTPVKLFCSQKKLPCCAINSVNESLRYIKYPFDTIFLLADFGMFIKNEQLTASRFGFWNIHPSLLPQYRGASPIQYALVNDEPATGVTIMQMDDLLDHGPILAQETIKIDNNDTMSSLTTKLARTGAELFLQCLQNPQETVARKKQQQHNKATYTKKITKKDALVPFLEISPYLTKLFKKYNLLHLIENKITPNPSHNGRVLYNKIRAFHPWPDVWSILPNGKIIKIHHSIYDVKNKTLTITEISIMGKHYQLTIQ